MIVIIYNNVNKWKQFIIVSNKTYKLTVTQKTDYIFRIAPNREC